MTPEILGCLKFRDNLYTELKSTTQDSPAYDTIKINLHTYRDIVNRNIRQAKAIYYTMQLEKYRFDIKRTWSTIHGIIHKSKSKADFPKYFLINGEKVNDSQEIANQFNEYFSNIGPKLSNSIIYEGNKSVQSYLKSQIMFSFSFQIVQEKDILDTVKDLSSKTSCGYDNTSTQLLKLIIPSISQSISLIVNQSLNTGIFPDNLKIAKVIPLFKKGDTHTFDNYRPISLLPAISKIFEKIACKQLYKYFTDHKLLYENQYGFRKDHSTELASLEISDRILHDLDNSKIPISVFLDLSKAFDTLDHSILTTKLKYYGINGTALEWFRSYLSNRKQFVDFNGTYSTMSSINTGVPQGSILGPLLFIIYINDIHEASDKFHAIVYADDTNLLNSLCTFDTTANRNSYNKTTISQNINLELDKIHEWLVINKLSLNVKKTTYMLFHHRQKSIEHLLPSLKIKNCDIARVSSFNFLGLNLDEHMSWNSHINKVSNRISRSLGVMNRIKRFLPTYALKLMYNSLILPHLQYSILTWGYKADRLIKLQKRAVRIVTCSKYNSHTDPLFRKLNILKLTDIFVLCNLKFYFKYEGGTLPHYFTHMFQEHQHAYFTRHRGGFYQCKPNTSSGIKCIRYFLPSLLSDTPACIKDKVHSHSFKGFTGYIKQHFINQYSTECSIQNCYICNR